MDYWLLDTIKRQRQQALKEANHIQFYREMGHKISNTNEKLLQETAEILEIAVIDLQNSQVIDEPERLGLSRKAAADAFHLLHVLSLPKPPIERATHLLRALTLAVIGDRKADAACWFRALEAENQWPDLPLASYDWGERCRATLLDVWLRLIRKKGREDRDVVLKHIAVLRDAQKEFEKNYLCRFDPIEAKRRALELIVVYHLAKAADILVRYIADDILNNTYQIQLLLDNHFNRAIDACRDARLNKLEPLVRLLSCATAQMINYAT